MMRLSGIEIEVGGLSEKLPECRPLSYLMVFTNEAGKEYHRRHETLLLEQTLDDTPGIARIVSQVVCGLLMEDADLDDTEAFDGFASAHLPLSSGRRPFRPSGTGGQESTPSFAPNPGKCCPP